MSVFLGKLLVWLPPALVVHCLWATGSTSYWYRKTATQFPALTSARDAKLGATFPLDHQDMWNTFLEMRSSSVTVTLMETNQGCALSIWRDGSFRVREYYRFIWKGSAGNLVVPLSFYLDFCEGLGRILSRVVGTSFLAWEHAKFGKSCIRSIRWLHKKRSIRKSALLACVFILLSLTAVRAESYRTKIFFIAATVATILFLLRKTWRRHFTAA